MMDSDSSIRSTAKRQSSCYERRRACVPAYFANPVHCSRLNGRPSVSFLPLPRIAVTQCSVSSRPVYITRHLSQLFVSGDIDSFSGSGPRSLSCRMSFVALPDSTSLSLHDHARVLRISKHIT